LYYYTGIKQAGPLMSMQLEAIATDIKESKNASGLLLITRLIGKTGLGLMGDLCGFN
jgi:hypothetical protein